MLPWVSFGFACYNKKREREREECGEKKRKDSELKKDKRGISFIKQGNYSEKLNRQANRITLSRNLIDL